MSVPKLRFPGFDGEWEEKLIGEIVQSVKSGTSKNRTDISEYPFFGSTGIIGFSETFEYSGKKILVARVGAYAGTLYKVDGEFAVSDNTLVIDNDDSSDLDFLYYFFLFYNLNKLVFGSGQPLITGGQLKDLPISLPSLEEQKKIAEFLSAVDEKIELLSRKKSLLENYKKGVMQKLFSQQLRFKDDNGNDFPEWKEVSLKDLADICYGKDQKEINDPNGAYPIYGTGGLLGWSDSFLYDKPSVLIGRKGTIDKPMYVETPFWTVDTLFYTKVKELTDTLWLYYKFQTISWYDYNEASGVPSLSASTINKITINHPSLAEQKKIADFLSSIDEKIELVGKQIERMKLYKKGLLQQMFV